MQGTNMKGKYIFKVCIDITHMYEYRPKALEIKKKSLA